MAKGTADTSLVKQAYLKMHYTPQEAAELMKCQDSVTGPEYFLRHYFYIIHPKRGEILFDPFDYQIDLINNYHNYRFSINMLGRQMGKCLTKKINITIRNKKGEIYDIPIGLFYEYEKAKRDGAELPDISIFKRSDQYMHDM